MSDEIRPQPSSLSDTFALILLATAVGGVGYLLHTVGAKLGAIYEAFYPSELSDGSPIELPAVTTWALKFPFLVVFGLVAAVIGVFAFTLQDRPWIRRHLLLIVSIIWATLGFVGFVAMLGFAMPMVTVFGPWNLKIVD